ncbi:MAG: ATP-binding protein [Gammaproteobacteria bacterium]|nr:ATP-binding protein [Gammaproteobacteria bacterium]
MPVEKQSDSQRESLEAAFLAFNEVSDQLQNSYAGLQAEVSRLQQELAQANRKSADEAKKNAELAGRLAALLEALPGGVVMLDGNGVVRELNATATDFFGTPLQDTAWASVRERAFHPGSGEAGDLALHDGRRLNLAQRLLDPGPGRVLLFTDVTEHHKVQELVARHQRLAALGEMAAALAHQIRTPLSAALLYTENAARGDLSVDKRESLLAKAGRCLHDLEQLVADMLRFARGASNAETPVRLGDLLGAVRDAVAGIKRDNQSIDIDVDDADLVIGANREALTGAILNLASNALHHAGVEAIVVITARRRGNTLELRVSDNGPGVPREFQDKIFEPFFTSRADGTGLGLAVVRSVARAHGGDVTLDSTKRDGASFVIRLPLEQLREAQVEAEVAA